jgi:hypothetical protein
VHYQNVYNSSEGFFAFQDTLDCDDLLLHLDNGVFYEFIPFEDKERGGDAVSIEHVQAGVNYSMAITTNSGLWRYVIGDTVEFTSTDPYRIRITGRTKHYINVFGEEVTINNTDKALAAACREMNAEVSEYTVAPVYTTHDKPGRHEWAIEFTKAPADITAFATLLLNSDYQAKRSDGLAMSRLSVLALREGTFYRWLNLKGKLGSQHKIPRLKNDRGFIIEIKDISDLIL